MIIGLFEIPVFFISVSALVSVSISISISVSVPVLMEFFFSEIISVPFISKPEVFVAFSSLIALAIVGPSFGMTARLIF